jgi:hypothetical protein
MTPSVLASAPTAPQVLLRVLFIDAGPSKSAWVVVEVRSDGAVVPVQGSWRSMADDAWLGGVMESVWDAGGVVALEYISGALYDKKRWYDLCETLRIEGEIRRTAATRGAEVALVPFAELPARRRAAPRTLFCVPATSWRKELLQRGQPHNAEIEVVVRHLCGRAMPGPNGVVRVIDLPAAKERDAREHIVDALGGALVVAAGALGVRLRVPAAIRQEQELARAEARQHRSIKGALKRLNIDPSRAKMADGTPVEAELKKRRPSRGTRAMRRVMGANTKATRRNT